MFFPSRSICSVYSTFLLCARASYYAPTFSDEFEMECTKLLSNNKTHKIILIVIPDQISPFFMIDYCLSKLNDCSTHCLIKHQQKSKE